MSDTIVVCGAGGFIGGHLVKQLLAEGKAVRACDTKPFDDWHQLFNEVDNRRYDLRSLDECRHAIRGAAQIYNLAADMGGMGYIETHKAECMLSVLINTHLLIAARDVNVQKFLFTSSACVYNAARQTETQATALKESDAYPAAPEDGYGWEKLFSERMCSHFRSDYGLDTRVARLHNVYGPCGTYHGGREKAPAAICRKVAMAKISGIEDIEIWGDGHQTRSFMYVDDCVTGLLKLMDSTFPHPMNIGSSEMVSIDELVTLVERIADVQCRRRYNVNAPRGVRGRNSDNALCRRWLEWEPSIRLVDGLRHTYDWIYDRLLESPKHR